MTFAADSSETVLSSEPQLVAGHPAAASLPREPSPLVIKLTCRRNRAGCPKNGSLLLKIMSNFMQEQLCELSWHAMQFVIHMSSILIF